MIRISWKTMMLLLVAGIWADAQSPRLGLQAGWGQSKLTAVDLSSSTGTLSVDPVPQQAFTLRGSASWVVSPGWSLETSLGWRSSSRGGLDYRSSATGTGRMDVRQALSGQIILGGLACRDFQAGAGAFSLGAGLDLRAERLSAETAKGSSRASLTRPWLRAVARYTWEAPWRPFVALEIAAPLGKSSTSAADYIQDLDRLDTASNPSAGTVAKAHAPASEIIVALGLRFPR